MYLVILFTTSRVHSRVFRCLCITCSAGLFGTYIRSFLAGLKLDLKLLILLPFSLIGARITDMCHFAQIELWTLWMPDKPLPSLSSCPSGSHFVCQEGKHSFGLGRSHLQSHLKAVLGLCIVPPRVPLELGCDKKKVFKEKSNFRK